MRPGEASPKLRLRNQRLSLPIPNVWIGVMFFWDGAFCDALFMIDGRAAEKKAEKGVS